MWVWLPDEVVRHLTWTLEEVDLAIVADIGTMQRLPHLVGDQRAREFGHRSYDLPIDLFCSGAFALLC